jgi:macrolide transport system ATP-binding/permease protein
MFAWIRMFASRMRGCFLRRRVDEDFEQELRAHLEMLTQENIQRGMAPIEANRVARIRLGGLAQLQETNRELKGLPMLEIFLRDVRFAFRTLRKSPGFAAVAILTLALGIGANTAIFAVVHAALLRPLPYADAQRLMLLGESRNAENAGLYEASYPNYVDWVHSVKKFQSLAGYSGEGFTVVGSSGDPQFVDGGQVTTNFFATLGIRPMLGRDFVAGEDVPLSPKSAILSYDFWLNNCGGDSQIIGHAVQLDNQAVTVVGVLPKNFEFALAGSPALWVPVHLDEAASTRRNMRWLHVVGRLAPGVSSDQAKLEMQGITKQLSTAYPQQNGKIFFMMSSLRDRIVGDVRPLLLIVFCAVALVLMIACANVANLLMVRASGRRREFAIRAALGANRANLIRQSLTESMLLAVCGGVLGFALTLWSIPLLIAAIPAPLLDSMPYFRDIHPSLAVFAFLCGIAMLTGLVFGLAPALQISDTHLSSALKEESRGSHVAARSRLRDTIVVAEIAFSVVLLIGAGLLVKSLGALLHRNPGFATDNLLTFSVYLPDASYPDAKSVVRFVNNLTNRVRSLPGVKGADEVAVLPLTGSNGSIRFVIEGRPVEKGQEDECNINGDTPGYFPTMNIPLIGGRFFNESDDAPGKSPHIIVNQAFVKRYFANENPIGKQLRFTYSDKQPFREIVGIVGNTANDMDGSWTPAIYLPFEQSPDSFFNYAVRTSGNPATVLNAIRGVIHDADPQLALIHPLTMDQIIRESPSVFLRRFPSYLVGGFALLALILGTVGLYGLISYSVSQRTREFGIRMAIGARQRDILLLVLSRGARLIFVGIGIGTVAALGLTRTMSSLLYGTNANDPLTFAGVAVLLTLVALLACYIPARHATRVDPLIALRYE